MILVREHVQEAPDLAVRMLSFARMFFGFERAEEELVSVRIY